MKRWRLGKGVGPLEIGKSATKAGALTEIERFFFEIIPPHVIPNAGGQTQSAYRIGGFFHETPQGIRRGVIRQVPPAQTPVPFIAENTQRKAAELLDAEQEQREGKLSAIGPGRTIIEIPRWLARLEPALAASASETVCVGEQTANAERQEPHEASSDRAEPQRQRMLS